MSAVECEEVPADKLEEVDFDALPFNDNRYWAHFYDDEDEDQRDFYDWYSAESWLPAAVETLATRVRTASGKDVLDVLDVGCGVSPLLFALAEAHPGGWGDLHGVDFAAGAIQFCSAAAAKQSHAGLRFTVGDALALDTCVPDESADVVVDKGCLDCFVTGDGEANVAAYIAQLARIVRKPHGRVIIFAVNGADVPHLLRTGEIQADANCAKGSTLHRQAAWGQAKREKQTAHGQDAAAWVQQLWLVETVACAEKHVLVCATQAPSEANSVPPLRCNECGRRHACGVGPSMPEACPCGCKLRRFALS